MTITELNQEKDEIEEKIKILVQERDELVNKIEEKNIEDEEDEITKENKNPNLSINIFMSIMSFVGIIVGVIYVIYFKKEGL